MDQGALSLFVNSIKPGLNSKNLRCFNISIDILTKIKKGWANIENFDIVEPITKAFLAHKESFPFEKTVNFIYDLRKSVIYETWTEIFRIRANNNKLYFEIILEFVPYILKNDKHRTQFHNKEIFTYWIDTALTHYEKHSSSLYSLTFLCELWCFLSKPYEISEENATRILNSFKTGLRDSSLIFKTSCFT